MVINIFKVHVYVYSIIPFSILVCSNLLLIKETLYKSRAVVASTSHESQAKRKRMSLSILIMTITFILLTLPTTIAGGYFIKTLISTELGFTILFICDSLAFSYHALNFVVFLVFNKKFSREFKLFIRILCKSGIIDVDSTPHVNNITPSTRFKKASTRTGQSNEN